VDFGDRQPRYLGGGTSLGEQLAGHGDRGLVPGANGDDAGNELFEHRAVAGGGPLQQRRPEIGRDPLPQALDGNIDIERAVAAPGGLYWFACWCAWFSPLTAVAAAMANCATSGPPWFFLANRR